MNNEGNENFMTTANHYVSEHTRKRLGATAFPADSIVFAKVGAAVFLERKKILGQASCIDNNMAAFVVDKSRSDVGFVHYLLLSKKLGDLVATTALPALNAKQLGEMPLAVPPLAEQAAIAAVLSDMDAELSSLEARRNKTHGLKQAMMQELLTGKTRLR
jgi:type I restriction enzyme S subunit